MFVLYCKYNNKRARNNKFTLTFYSECRNYSQNLEKSILDKGLKKRILMFNVYCVTFDV